MRAMTLVLAVVLLGVSPAASPQQRSISHFSLEYRGPVALSDRATQTLFYAESDGRHLVAIQFSGKVLWTRDLYADTAKAMSRVGTSDSSNPLGRMLDEERQNRKIVAIRGADPPQGLDGKKKYLSIAFSSADFLIVDASTGNGLIVGRD
jgi:hypothetical protein